MSKIEMSQVQKIYIGLALVLTISSSGFCYGQTEDGESPLSMTLDVGYEWDDNVTTSELDNSSGVSDESLVADLGISLNLGTESFGVELGYDFSQTDYVTQNAFDIQSNTFTLILDKDVLGLNLMGIGLYTDVELAGAGLLDMSNYIFSAGKLVTQRWYFNPNISFSKKDFDTNNDRDADQYGYDMSLLYLGEAITLRFAYRYENEDTVGSETDYDANIYTVSGKGKISPISPNFSFEIKYQKNDKSYENITQSIGGKRSDGKDAYDIALTYKFNDHLELSSGYTYVDSNSNLSSSDFEQNIYNLTLGLKY